MATKKMEKVIVWLAREQVEWLQSKENQSATIRALITEQMNMERLAQSVKKRKKK